MIFICKPFRNSTLNYHKMHLKNFTTKEKKELSPLFQNMGFHDFWRNYDNLNVAIHPNQGSA